MKRVAPLLLIFLLAAAPAAAQWIAAEDWVRYRNPRYGTVIEYPADVFTRPMPRPANGDGRSFRSEDGRATFGVFGSVNSQGLTPASYIEELLAPLLPVSSYRRVASTWFVLSGTRGEDVFYQRCNFSRDLGMLHCLTMTYPAEEVRAWDRVVTRMSRSLGFSRVEDD